MSEDAKAKVGQAKTDTDEVQKRMQKALEDIKSIISDLENMREISMSDLDELGMYYYLNFFIAINVGIFYISYFLHIF